MQRLAGFFGHDGVDEVSGDAVAGALRVQLGGTFWPSVISAKSSQKTQAWRSTWLSGRCDCETMQLQIAQRAVVVRKSPAAVARTGHRSRGRRVLEWDMGFLQQRMAEAILPGIEPQRVDEVAAGQPAAASGRPGGGRCRSVEDADSGHGRSCERRRTWPRTGRTSLVGWDEKDGGLPGAAHQPL